MLKPFILFSIFSAFLNVYWITRLPFLNFCAWPRSNSHAGSVTLAQEFTLAMTGSSQLQQIPPQQGNAMRFASNVSHVHHKMHQMFDTSNRRQVKWEADMLILKKVQGQKVLRNILRGDMQNGQNGHERLSLTVTKLDNKATEIRSGEPARSERVAPVFRPSNLSTEPIPSKTHFVFLISIFFLQCRSVSQCRVYKENPSAFEALWSLRVLSNPLGKLISKNVLS